MTDQEELDRREKENKCIWCEQPFLMWVLKKTHELTCPENPANKDKKDE